MNYVIYEIATGKILQQIKCDENQIDVIVENWIGNNKVNFIQGDYAPMEYQIVNGHVQKLTTRPSHYHFWNYEQQNWVLDNNLLIQDIDKKRQTLLMQTDWMVTRQSEANVVMSDSWKNYRQALRDITKQSSYPIEIIWPTPPSSS